MRVTDLQAQGIMNGVVVVMLLTLLMVLCSCTNDISKCYTDSECEQAWHDSYDILNK